MVGLAVVLTLCILLSLAIAAATLSTLVRLVEPLPVASAAPNTTVTTRVLDYAAPSSELSLLTRWPWLIAPAPLLIGAIPITAMAQLAGYAWRSMNEITYPDFPFPRSFAVLPTGAMLLYLAGALSLCIVGLRRGPQERPAAGWSTRRALAVAAASLLVLLFVTGTMHRRAEKIVAQVYATNLLRVGETPLSPLSDERNAAVVYNKGDAAYEKGTPIRWGIEIAEREPVTPPPAFPNDQRSLLEALRQASRMAIEIGGPGRYVPDHFVVTSCGILQLHAVNAATVGNFGQAAADIAVMQRLAGQLAPEVDPDTSVTGMLASGRALQTIQAVMPFVKGEQQLDLLVLPQRQWYRDMGRRAARARQAHRVNLACWALNGESDPASPWTPKFRAGAIVWRDISVPEEAVEVERHYATVLSCWDLPDECKLTRRLMDEMARIKGGSPFVQEDLRDAPLEPVRRLIERDLTEAAIAATRYRLRHGRLPDSWEELTSDGMLKAVPLNLFTGTPATMSVVVDQVLFSAGGIQAIAASRPLWEVFGMPQASTRPVGDGK